MATYHDVDGQRDLPLFIPEHAGKCLGKPTAESTARFAKSEKLNLVGILLSTDLVILKTIIV